MVNYCCIQGCSRNSRIHKHLNFYSLPKEKHRQKQWLKLARRDDLLHKDMDKLRKTLRFCSRHFPPNNIVKRYLSPDALPTKSIPGSIDEDEPDVEPERHEGIICDSCQDSILGFRYKCVTCDNFDLCQKCEMLEKHAQHYMLRIPKSIRFQLADDLISKWRSLFQSEHLTPHSDSSSDDEPVTKYIRNDHGVELTEKVKADIRKEVARVLKAVKRNVKDVLPTLTVTKNIPTPKRKVAAAKEVKMDDSEVQPVNNTQAAPELVFADVNELKFDQANIKPTTAVSVAVPTISLTDQTPMSYVILSNDLTQFMIELAPPTNANESIMK